MTLQLTRLRVEQFRRFRQPLVLDGLAPGLNIVSGPNEAGKSTLVRAIRAAFFERHKSTVVEDLRPWGEGSSAAPTVELDFLLDGQAHHLVKSFLGKKRCTLQIGSRLLDGVEAEEHLAQRFGFSFAAKGASKPEHWGIPGLLWVEQGSGQLLDVSHARDHLHDALREAVDDSAQAALGALAASGGDEVLAELREARNALLTSTGKPRAELLAAAEQMASLQAELLALDAELARYREQVDQLASLRAAHQADESAQPWQALQQQLVQAQARQRDLQAGEAQWRADQTRLSQLTQTRALLAKEIEALVHLQQAAEARAAALAQAQTQLEAAEALMPPAQRAAAAAQAQAQRARQVALQARRQTQRRGFADQLQQAQAEAARCAEALQRAESAQAALQARQAQAAAVPALSPAQLRQLQQLERAVSDAALQHQAVSTRLQFSLPPGQALGLETEGRCVPLQAEGEALLDRAAVLHLPGGGELRITPGGQDLALRSQAHARAVEAFDAALRAAGIADLAEAEARLAAHQQAQAQVALATQALAIVAPQGLEPLRAAGMAAAARRAAAEAALAQAASTADGLAGSEAAASSAPGLDPAQAEAALDAAIADEQRTAAELAKLQSGLAAALSQRDAAQRELATARGLLADPAHAVRQAQAHQDLLQAAAEAEALAARVAAAGAQLQAARPDLVAQDIERLGRSIEQLQRAHQQRREALLVLEGSLAQAGAQALEERRESLVGALAHTRRRHGELQRRAEALDLLCRLLDAKRQATLARLQAPLQARLQHYLPVLLPAASVQIDAGLQPGLITRPAASGLSESGPLAELSFGAREQLGLISRLAYADLLQQAGRPTLLILDDALVHSDGERLAQMKRVLFDAAQRHQVLLFTCHPESWRDLGVPVRALSAP